MNTANGHYYYVYKLRMTPEESQSYCESLAASSGLSHVTLGGTDLGYEDTRVWMNGETWVYSNWDDGEPNNVFKAI